jgi:prepilin-type N-terminal cleavage/methylation domain-containing protein
VRQHPCNGMTLLEVMVALSIAGVGFAAVLNLISMSARSAELTGKYTQAACWAESKMAEVLSSGGAPDRPAGGWCDPERVFAWRLESGEAGSKIKRVIVTVSFSAPGGTRDVVLESWMAERKLARIKAKEGKKQ